ncbi:MAG: hypothetical protein KDA29_00215 [Phycisphaerales bacterium]|nr:hypothetical protein [Phycisphaerales bacterium]
MTTTIRSAITLALFSGTICVPALGMQPEAAEPSPTVSRAVIDSDSSSDRTRVSLIQDLPWLVRRAAILDLRLHESPAPIDYELTANLLSIASDLDPTNAEYARDMAQASWLAGDQSLMLEATRRVIKIDPKDSVAQLRLISAKINEKQTLEERKALYDRFLSDAGKSIDPSVRSRLALDAALLEREAGNTTGFIERLHQATRLDVSNKSAASLAAQFYASESSNLATTLDYQLRLLYADPLDANVHLSIARKLAREGALRAAKRYLDNAYELFKLETGRSPEDIEEIRIAIDWQVDGADAPIGRLNAMLNDQRIAAQSQIEAFELQQLPTDDLTRPEEIRYTLGVDRLRLLAAQAEGDAEQVRSVLDDIEKTINDELIQYAQMSQAPGADVNTLFSYVVQRLAELQTMRAIVGLDSEKIRSDIKEIKEKQPGLAARLGSIESMALFAEGQYEESLKAAEKYQGTPVVEIVRAQCLEKLGRTDEAIELYLRLAHSNATNGYGAFSHTRLLQLGAGDRVLTEVGREMTQIAERAPFWIEEMINRPSSFQYLSVTQDKRVYSEADRPILTIKLQNTAPIPLAVGPNAPISSRLLIEPVGVATPQNGFVGDPRANIVQLDTRLRLMPREAIEIQIVGDSVNTDWLIEQQPSLSIRQRWRLIQGFTPRLSDQMANRSVHSPDSSVFGLVKSPLGLTAETKVVQRLGLTVYRSEPGELIAMLESGDPDTRRRALSAISARFLNAQPETQFDQASVTRIIEAINTLYTNASNETRAAMLLTLPQRHQVPAMMAFDDHVASSLLSEALIDSSVNPLVLACALLTRTDDPDSPIFETIEHANDVRVARISEIVRVRLREGIPLIGTLGPGVEAMTPTFDGLDY